MQITSVIPRDLACSFSVTLESSQYLPVSKKEEGVRKTHVPSQTWGTISSASGQSGSSGFLSMLFKTFVIPAAAMGLSFRLFRDVEEKIWWARWKSEEYLQAG